MTTYWVRRNQTGQICEALAYQAEGAVALDDTDLELQQFLGLAPRPASADDVRAEAQRRMMLLLSARDPGHLERLITNGTREAVRLQNKRLIANEQWTPQEAARAAELAALDAAIEAIRDASNALEPAPPFDYMADSHWPVIGG